MTNQEKIQTFEKQLKQFEKNDFCSIQISANMTIGFRYLDNGETVEITSVRNSMPSCRYIATISKEDSMVYITKELKNLLKIDKI